MEINRRSFLRQLESCTPGLANTGNIENAEAFVFANNSITTFNDEIRCKQDTEFPFSCVVPSRPLIETLRKLTEEEVSITCDGKKLGIVCPGVRKININIKADMPNHGSVVEEPENWVDVVPAFADGLALVAEVADAKSDQAVGCVHLRPKGLEATDGFQAIRYRVDVPVGRSSLVKRSACTAVKGMGIAALAETNNWIHWKTYTGLVVSVRRYVDPFPDLNPYFGVNPADAQQIRLPSVLIEALQKATMFLPDTEAGKVATFKLHENKLVIKGQNDFGSYEERRDIAYDGPSVCFGMSPKYMENLLKHDYPCLITDSTVRVKGDSFVYVTAKEVPASE